MHAMQGVGPTGVVAPRAGQSLPMLLLRLRDDVLLRLRPVLQGFDVTEQQARVLLVLREGGTLELGALAEACCMHGPSLSRIMPRMREEGLIEQHKPPSDQRRTLVRLSPEGLRLEAGLRDALRDAYAEVGRRVGRDRLRGVSAGLRAAIDALADAPAGAAGVAPAPADAAPPAVPPAGGRSAGTRARIARLERIVADAERAGHEQVLAPARQLIETLAEGMREMEALRGCLEVVRTLAAAPALR